ncbi:PGPGW domain-containing protein [Actomonas aquatica]|uniref:PGPGW domain-containing protein n=1 Tax=Actomonas aquatica TaxID=2866162 RepID=A0ABZ1C6R6_9BACT|nr:PGPGW domain-containing protein [Opitutus sp. WL0086]WRQ86010.1 PGPGW domain-containing protein [Opitutus sp. WL0086]
MVESLTREFQHWQRGTPGRRFIARYRHSRREQLQVLSWRRILRWVIGLTLVAIGAVLTVAPGPATIFFIIGGGLLAKESRWVARLLDAAELKLQPVVCWLQRHYARLSPPNQKRLQAVLLTTSVIGIGITVTALFR